MRYAAMITIYTKSCDAINTAQRDSNHTVRQSTEQNGICYHALTRHCIVISYEYKWLQ